MTAKILTRQSFSRATNYVFKDGRSEVIDSRGIMATDPLSAAASFKVQAMLRPEIKSPVGHICISFHPDDTPRLTNDLMVELCEAYMKGMGIKDTQFLLVRHYDTKHPHMHLVFNRIDDNGKLISDRMWYVKNEKVCKQIKTEYSLTFSKGKQNVNLDRLRPEDRIRYEMYYDVKNALSEATSFTDFQIRLEDVGIKTVIKRSSKSGDFQGITFKRDGYSIKGSKLDRSLSLIKIMNRIPKDNKIQRQEPNTLCRFMSLEEIQAMEAERQKHLRETKHESHQETHQESKVQELAASLFEGNLGKSQEQEMKEDPKKKKRVGVRR